MTWAEFSIRLHAYKRLERKEWYKVREIAYAATVGAHLNPKRLPKTKEQFMPLNLKFRNTQRERIAKRIKEAQNEYYKQLKIVNNGTA
jgi:hypothetical protein